VLRRLLTDARRARRVYSAAVHDSDDPHHRSDRPWPDLLLDVGPVVGLLAFALLIAGLERQRVPLALAAMVLPLIGRRRWPLPVLLAVAALAVATSEATPGPWIQIASVSLASFTAGERATDRTRSAVSVMVVAAPMSAGFLARDAEPFESLVLPFVILVPSWLVGDVVRTRRVEAAERLDAAERAAGEAEARLQAAVTAERRR